MVVLIQLVVLIIAILFMVIVRFPELLAVLLCLALLLCFFGKRGQENREEAEGAKGDGKCAIEKKEH